MLSKAEARFLAVHWHGGQDSPLYALLSTGTVVPGLTAEVRACYRMAAPEDAAELEALLEWADRAEYPEDYE